MYCAKRVAHMPGWQARVPGQVIPESNLDYLLKAKGAALNVRQHMLPREVLGAHWKPSIASGSVFANPNQIPRLPLKWFPKPSSSPFDPGPPREDKA